MPPVHVTSEIGRTMDAVPSDPLARRMSELSCAALVPALVGGTEADGGPRYMTVPLIREDP